jgi:hypothetical protein
MDEMKNRVVTRVLLSAGTLAMLVSVVEAGRKWSF